MVFISLWMSVCAFRGGFTWAITLGITFTAPASTSFCMSGHKFCMSRHKFCMSGHKFLCLDTTFDTISGTTCHTTFCKKLCFDTTFMVSNTIFLCQDTTDYVGTQLLMSGHNFGHNFGHNLSHNFLQKVMFRHNLYGIEHNVLCQDTTFMSGHNFLCPDTTFDTTLRTYLRANKLSQSYVRTQL